MDGLAGATPASPFVTVRAELVDRRVGATQCVARLGRAARTRGGRVCVLVISLCLVTGIVAAQQPDSARAGVGRSPTAPPTPPPPPPQIVGVQPATLPRTTGPPVSPKAAFLYSLVLPGFGQAKLDRSYAGALFFTVEAVAFTMARQAEIDLKYAEAHSHDSTLVVQSYETDSLGQALHDSTGRPIPGTYAYARYDSARVAARKTHLEDWIAVIIFNHLLSATDAFVAAQLWDLRAHVHPVSSSSIDGKRQMYGLSVSW